LPCTSWELEVPFGNWWVSISSWPGLVSKSNFILNSWSCLGTMDQDSTFPLCHPTHLIHTSHSLQYPDHQDITWSPCDISCLGLCTNLHGCCGPCLQSSFTCIVKKFWNLSSFADLESCLSGSNFRVLQPGSRTRLPREGPGPPWNWRPSQKSWQVNFFWWKGCKHILTPAEQTCEHKMADSGFYLYPWHSCTCPSPGICPVKAS
jgi:hypothetical protein